ncbi:MAG: hypothetical protein JWP97_867 [Labilithrix sp.]|nr:hypothetical protein [Labilithrix sp.]
MSRRVAVALLGGLGALGAGCKEDTSLFPEETTTARDVQGRVWAGPELVVGAAVHLEPAPGYAYDEQRRAAGVAANGYAGVFTSTDLAGRYRVPDAPFAYDLWVRRDQEVAIFEGLMPRYTEPSFGDDGPLTGFTATVAASTSHAPSDGHSVAYFIAGADAKALTGEGGRLTATFGEFASTITLWAVEYVTALGLTAPTHVGSVDVRVTAGGTFPAVVPVTEIPDTTANDLTIDATPPPGMTVAKAELVVDFGVRREVRPIARFTPGQPFHVKVAIGGHYGVHVVAESGAGATSDSGIVYFDIFAVTPPAITLPLALPDVAFDGERTVSAGTQSGLVEHELVPRPGTVGPTVRIVTTDRAATLPDLHLFGTTQPLGSYAWSVSYYPALLKPYALVGPDVRKVTPVSKTAPRTIVLR